MIFLAQKQFGSKDQELFAEVSDDWNPMHMNSLTARRTQMGALVVHGMHTVLSCLDFFARSTKDLPLLSNIEVNFLKPVYLGDTVVFTVVRQSPLRLTAEVDGMKVLTVDLHLGFSNTTQTDEMTPPVSSQMNRLPRDRSFQDIEKAVGIIEHIPISFACEKLFPNAAQWIGKNRIGALAALSKVVGMECPGLHSILIGLK